MSNPTNIQTEGNKTAENHHDRYVAEFRKNIIEHPENELWHKQQLLILLHATDKGAETLDLAYEVLAKDTEGLYTSDCYLVLARIYTDRKEIDKAIDYYRKTIATDPTFDQPILELATLYENQLNYDAAIEVYDSLDEENFKDMQVDKYYNKGYCYGMKNEFGKALECFQSALKLIAQDKSSDTHEKIGGCYFNLNNFQEAFVSFRKALEINPKSAIAQYGIGLCYQHTNDTYRALHHYYEAIKLKPDYIEAYNNIAAVTINEEGDYKMGIEMLKKAIEFCNDKETQTMINLNLFRVYKKLKEFSLADYYYAEYLKSMGLEGFLYLDEDDE